VRRGSDALVVGAELFLEDADGGGEGGAELVGGCAPGLLSAAVEFGLEDVVVEPPAGDGDAVDAECGGGAAVGSAGDEEVDGALLLGGERGGVGREELLGAFVGVFEVVEFGGGGEVWLGRVFGGVVASCSGL
jgi:hypothetical protein